MRATTSLSVFLLCLSLITGIPGLQGSAAAQQQEKRIALVIGNGAYAKGPLATSANDAGLIAQTLQAAGFEVVGARDLDGDGLRKSFRDFIQKAESSGPGTVAMVYLAGYGIQLAGENYFIPVDSAIGRETDIPTEAVRINDYVRQLGSLPLKANIVVLDAARQQPFIEGGQPIASGLALVEPLPRMLIAFNAAPGTVAPGEQGPYGAYAQSLAEMIRTGGLPLPELFDRVRLRVNEASKGAQVPWHAHKLDANFVFFDRAPDAPAQPPPDQVAAIRNRPIRDLGASDAYAAALERDTLPAYEEFVAAYPGDPLARRVRALAAARREAITWLRTYRADTPQAYWSYLRRYPRGAHAADAHRRLAILAASLEPPPAFAAIDYDVPPPPPDEVVYVSRPVLMFSDPDFDFVPPPPPPVFFLPPPPPEFIVLEPPPPPIGLYILPQPLFVPIPLYVQAPVYVAPPQNNIIFANIHNTTVINTVINRPPPPQPAPVAPGSPAAPGGAKGGIAVVAPNAASPALPPSVAQKATLIQQGKLPVPPSASINPAVVKPGAPGAPLGARGGAAPNAPIPANAPPNAPPQGQPLPKANTLPVPGAKGAPPPPPSVATGAPATVNPSAKPGTAPAQQGATLPPGAAPGAAGAPKGPPTANVPPPVAGVPKAGGLPTTGAKPVVPDSAHRQGTAPGAPPPSAANLPAKPNVTVAPKPPQSAPPTANAPPLRPAPQLAKPTPPSPPPRITAPPPRISAPPPPRPTPQVARPAPPPPPARMAAPPPPPPRIAAPPPPPPPRPAAPPPQMARPAAPPPQMARPAPPPPVARPAAPPAAAAVKRCPPNVPKC